MPDLELIVESDSEEFLGFIDRDFSWFASRSTDSGDRMTVSFLQGNEREGASFRVDGADLPLDGHPSPAVYAWQMGGKMLMERMRNFFILHAAVTARNGKALAIVAPPGTGKTTLSLSLLADGLHFLSDDFCPIHRETRLVHPFPRSLWVAEDSPYAAFATEASFERTARSGKRAVQCCDGRLNVATSPVPIGSLVCLAPALKAPERVELKAGVRGEGSADFIRDLEALPGVSVQGTKKGEGFECHIVFPEKRGLSGKVGAVLARHRRTIWNVYRLNSPDRPDFSRDPVLSPIPLHEAAFFVMRELKQEHDLTESRDSSAGGSVGLFMELSWLLEGVPCFRLTPGRLDAMKRLVCNTLDRR